jgi:hypothetical protein
LIFATKREPGFRFREGATGNNAAAPENFQANVARVSKPAPASATANPAGLETRVTFGVQGLMELLKIRFPIQPRMNANGR